MSDIMEINKKSELFCAWLQDNGALFPKIDWPSSITTSGIRGAVAKADIQSNENMIQIPIKLMISPLHIFDNEEIGPFLKESIELLQVYTLF